MSVKLEIVHNYLKITDGSNNPVRYPYRDARFYANDVSEWIQLFTTEINGKLTDKIPFLDEPASGSVTINTTAATHATGTIILVSAVANTFSTGTAQCISVIAGNTLVANGVTYTAVDGAKTNNTEFSADTGDNECAADLKDSIENDTRPGTLGDISAEVTTNTVTITTDVLGVGGDVITLEETGGNITLSGALLSGGVTADTVLFDELIYTAVDGTKADDTEFDISGTNDQAAADLADSIDDDTRVGTAGDNATATATTNTVTIVSENGGIIGNATLLSSSSGTRLAVSAANLEGGLNDAEISGILVDAVEIMSGTEVEGDYPNELAIAIAANITAYTSIPNYNATAIGPAITIVAEDEDTNVNGFTVVSTAVKATKTDVNMAGATADIVDSAGDPFDTWADLITWLGKNTGGELIT